MSKITDYAAITSVQSDDLLVVVDVHDTSMAATGTDKKMQISQLPGSALTPNVGFTLATLPGLWAATSGSQAAPNEVVLSLATAMTTTTIGHLGTWIGGAGVTPGGTGINGLAIYSASGTLLGQTVDMTTAFEAAGTFAEAALTAGVPVVAGTNYWLAFMHNFTGTSPAIPGYVPPPASGVPIVHNQYQHLYIAPTVTAFPASFNPASAVSGPSAGQVGNNGQHWFFVAGSV